MPVGANRVAIGSSQRGVAGAYGRTLGAVLVAALLFHACEKSRPPPAGSSPANADDTGPPELDLDAGVWNEPPSLDAPGLCGNQIIGQVAERPNIYFVLDRSGSMAEDPEGDGRTKYDSVRVALRDVLQQVGHRIRYGAAVFPAKSATTECAAGVQVFETRDGDPVAYALQGELGPVLTDLLHSLSDIDTRGSTPTSATLSELAPTLEGLEGDTVVILATDGEPNCGSFEYCDPRDCGLVQSSYVLSDGRVCSETVNCCDPEIVDNGPEFCIDGLSTVTSIRALADVGIRTYVIGLPGSAAAENVLSAMALAGSGRAQEVAISEEEAADGIGAYYAVDEMENLASVLKKITTSVAIDCDIALETTPPAPSQVNVYFDGIVIPADPTDGWTLTGDRSLEIRGRACDTLSAGDIYQVQIVAGCPTVVL